MGINTNVFFCLSQNHVRTDPGFNLRAAFEERIKTRITVPINRIAKQKKKPNWMPAACFELLMKRADNQAWKAKAKAAQANRLKGGKDGKAPPTSTLGQQSAARAYGRLV
jgi:hypothetical protein